MEPREFLSAETASAIVDEQLRRAYDNVAKRDAAWMDQSEAAVAECSRLFSTMELDDGQAVGTTTRRLGIITANRLTHAMFSTSGTLLLCTHVPNDGATIGALSFSPRPVIVSCDPRFVVCLDCFHDVRDICEQLPYDFQSECDICGEHDETMVAMMMQFGMILYSFNGCRFCAIELDEVDLAPQD